MKQNKKSGTIAEEIMNGPIMPVSIKIVLPILAGQILVLLYGVIDTLFISMIDNSSTALISGVGLVFPIYMLFFALGVGLYTGISSLVARGIGEKNQFVLNKAANSGLLLSLVIAIIAVAVLSLNGKSILHYLAGKELSEESINYGIQYLYYLIPGLGFLLIFDSLLGVLQGEGLSQYYALSMVLSTIINIILDPIFIFVLKMGTAGASLATSISITISLLFIIFVFLTKKLSTKMDWNILNIEGKLILEILRIGIPQALTVTIVSVTVMFLNKLMGSISEDALNSWVLVGRMDEFIIMVGYSFGSSTLTLIGQNYGRQNLKRVLDIYKANILLSIIISAVFALIYNLIAGSLFSLFTSLPHIVDRCVLQVRIIAFSQVGVVATLIVTSAFQATGWALPGLGINAIRMLILIMPLSYCLVELFDKGVFEVFLAIAATNIITFLIAHAWCYSYLKKVEFKDVIKLHSSCN